MLECLFHTSGYKPRYFVPCWIPSPVTWSGLTQICWMSELVRNRESLNSPSLKFTTFIEVTHPRATECLWPSGSRWRWYRVSSCTEHGVKVKLTWLCGRGCTWIILAPREWAREWLNTGSLRGLTWKSHRPGFKSWLYHLLGEVT